MRVRVYFNLHKKCFSVQDASTRRVIAHKNEVFLENVTFKVYEKGRQRVLREGKKNVHAFVIGNLVDGLPDLCYSRIRVIYNPYFCEKFTIDYCGRVQGIVSSQYAELRTLEGKARVYAVKEL